MKVQRSWIDSNDHVNNSWYVKTAFEQLPQDLEIRQLRVEYKKQAYEGDILYLKSVEKKHKKEPTGEINQKTGKKIYKDVQDKFEFWLKNFTIKNDVEEELV